MIQMLQTNKINRILSAFLIMYFSLACDDFNVIRVQVETGGSVVTANGAFNCDYQFNLVEHPSQIIEGIEGVDPMDLWNRFIECTAPFAVDSEAELVAQPDYGFRFVGWDGDICDGEISATCHFSVPAVIKGKLHSVAARFTEDTNVVGTKHRVHIPINVGGSVQASEGDWDCTYKTKAADPEGCVAWFQPGESLTFNEVPGELYQFKYWRGACGVNIFGGPCHLTVNDSAVVGVRFEGVPGSDIDSVEFADPAMQACWQEDKNEYRAFFGTFGNPVHVSVAYYMDCSDRGIASLAAVPGKKGLEGLVYLRTLILASNDISDVNLNQLSKLEYLDFFNNQGLTSIDLVNNPKLKTLDITNNSITGHLDLSNNPLITTIRAWSNGINSVDLANNLDLLDLNLMSNNIDSLDISNNLKLIRLQLSHNDLVAIDLSNKPELLAVELRNNQLTSIDLDSLPKLRGAALDFNNFDQATVNYITQFIVNHPEVSISY